MDASFLFSIVIAVYNSAAYLEETIQSILHQSMDFSCVQIILVDDGSTDESGAICDEYERMYPQQILSLHKENGGQSSARNLGMAQAAGKYLNFLDSDDHLSPDTLKNVAEFMELHDGEVDVAAIPLRYFEAQEGEHWQNDLFHGESRIVDLRTDYQVLQASASSAFFVRDAVKDIRFQEGMGYAEDTRYAMTCLARKQRIALIHGCWYAYRIRQAGNSSTQGLQKHPFWKREWMDMYEFWAIDFFRNRMGSVPRWVQYALLCHLWGRIAIETISGYEEGDPDYIEQVTQVASWIEKEVMASAERVDPAIRLLLLSRIHPDEKLCVMKAGEKEYISFSNVKIRPLQESALRLNRMVVADQALKMNGMVTLLPGVENVVSIRCAAQGKETTVRLIHEKTKDLSWNGIPICQDYTFEADINLEKDGVKEIALCWRVNDTRDRVSAWIVAGDYIPVLPVAHSTGWTGGWKYIVSSEKIMLIPCANWLKRARRELRWECVMLRNGKVREVWQRQKTIAMRAVGRESDWISGAKTKNMAQLSEDEKWNADLLFSQDE